MLTFVADGFLAVEATLFQVLIRQKLRYWPSVFRDVAFLHRPGAPQLGYVDVWEKKAPLSRPVLQFIYDRYLHHWTHRRAIRMSPRLIRFHVVSDGNLSHTPVSCAPISSEFRHHVCMMGHTAAHMVCGAGFSVCQTLRCVEVLSYGFEEDLGSELSSVLMLVVLENKTCKNDVCQREVAIWHLPPFNTVPHLLCQGTCSSCSRKVEATVIGCVVACSPTLEESYQRRRPKDRSE